MSRGGLCPVSSSEWDVFSGGGEEAGIPAPSNYWPCDDTSGGLADSTGSNNLAQVGSPTYSHSSGDAVLGTAVKTVTRGSDYFADTGGIGGPDGTSDFTFNILFKAAATGTQGLFGWYTSGTHNLYLYYNTQTQMYMIADHSSGTLVEESVMDDVNDSTWHMATMVHDVSEKRFLVYIDKLCVISERYSGTLKDFSSSEFYIGRIRDNSAVGSIAFFDEPKFWDGEALTPTQIRDIYDAYFPA